MALEIHQTGISDSLVILGAAGLVIPAFARFRISPVIGFILVGILVGPFGLGAHVERFPWLYYITITSPQSMEPLAELGIILLLFSIGLELSFKRLWRMRRLVFGIGSAELFGCAIFIALTLWLLGNSVPAATGLGLALALSSTALVLPIAGTQGPVGKSAFAMLLFEDLALVPIIFLLGALAPAAADEGWSGLISTLAYGGMTVAALLLVGRYALPYVFAQAARTKSPEVFLAASLLIVILSSLLTSLAGLSPIVGALLAGLLIAETDYRGEVEVMTAPFKGLALGIFLITIGMSLDLQIIAEKWPALLLAIASVVVIKTTVTAILLRLSGASKGVATEVGLLMASPSETTLIVLSTAVAARIILPEAATFWQIATAIGLTITPLLAYAGHWIARRMEMRGGSAGDLLSSTSEEQRTVVIGFGRVGRIVCNLLRQHKQAFIIIDNNADTVAQARREDYPIMFGDVARTNMLERLKFGNARAVILTMDDPVLSVSVARKIRNWMPDLPIIARARDTGHASELFLAGVSDAVPETLEASLQLAETALVELGVAMGPVIASIHQQREDLRQEIKDNAQLDVAPRLRPMRVNDVSATPNPISATVTE
jgi:monovalent cation:H+ antiporter-2, CPA2 family